jgi:hypothetical protein
VRPLTQIIRRPGNGTAIRVEHYADRLTDLAPGPPYLLCNRISVRLRSRVQRYAILARSLGIPVLAGIEARAMELPNGTYVILDRNSGALRLNPSPDEIAALRKAQARQEEQRKENLVHTLEYVVYLKLPNGMIERRSWFPQRTLPALL